MRITNRLVHAAIAAIPVLLSPLLVFALAEGWVDLGGGEKDILFVIPYFILTITFFVCALVLIVKRWPIARWINRSTAVSIAFLIALGTVAYITSWIGVS